MGLESAVQIPGEVMGNILQHLNPNRLHALASYSKVVRYMINNYMERYKYLSKWVDNYAYYEYKVADGLDKDKVKEDEIEYEIEYELNNYWYYRLHFKNDTYPILFRIIDRIEKKTLYIDMSVVDIKDGDEEKYDMGVFADVYGLGLSCTNITDKGLNIGKLRNLHTLQLVNCKNIVDLRPNPGIDVGILNIKNVYVGMTNITDVGLKALCNAYRLYLYSCENITSEGVKELGSVYNLNLSMCNNVYNMNENLGILGNVHTLDLGDCKNIISASTDNEYDDINANNKRYIGALGNVHTLDILNCKNIGDVSTLGNVYNLTIPAKDFSCIINYNKIEGISALGNVHSLELFNYNSLTDMDIVTLGNVHKLNLGNCYNITDIGIRYLGGIYYLDLTRCIKICDVSSLGNVSRLILSYCDNITDMSVRALSNVEELYLDNCGGLTSIDLGTRPGGLGNIQKLSLACCNNIREIVLSSGDECNIRYINMSHCLDIEMNERDISILDNIYELNLTGCPGITDASICGLVKPHILYLYYCDGITKAGIKTFIINNDKAETYCHDIGDSDSDSDSDDNKHIHTHAHIYTHINSMGTYMISTKEYIYEWCNWVYRMVKTSIGHS